MILKIKDNKKYETDTHKLANYTGMFIPQI